MKITTEEHVQELDEKIKSELGIDVGKYRDPEIAEKFVDLLIFPQFVLSWTLRPVFIGLVLYIAVFFFFEIGPVWAVVYGIFGLILFLVNGVLSGILLVLWKLKTDIYSIIEYSLTIMKDSVVNIKHLNRSVDKTKRKETLGLLFLGITHIVTIPMASEAISGKIPLLGGLFSGLIAKILRLVAGKIKFDYDPKEGDDNTTKSPEEITNAYIRTIDSATNGIEKTLSIVLRVSQLPIAIATCITMSLLIILLLVVT